MEEAETTFVVAEDMARFWLGGERLPARSYRDRTGRAVARVLDRAIGRGISGGAIYDAVVGATARHAGARLLTRDRRAIEVYRALDVDYDLVG